jgi:hypothetical protein
MVATPNALVFIWCLLHVALLQALFFDNGIAVKKQTPRKQSLREG